MYIYIIHICGLEISVFQSKLLLKLGELILTSVGKFKFPNNSLMTSDSKMILTTLLVFLD